MTIKNFFIRGEKLKSGIKGLKYARYLINQAHPNHTSTNIKELWGDCEEWIENSIRSAVLKNEHNSNSKGGRPINRYGHSFVLSLPRGASNPTDAQWKQLLNPVMKVLGRKLDIAPTMLLKSSYIVCHEQANPHVHLLVASVVNEVTLNQKLSSIATTNAMKIAFDSACLKVLGLDKDKYTPSTKHSERGNRAKYLERLNKKAENQLRKLISALSNEDMKNLNRQYNRLTKTIVELDSASPEIANKLRKKLKLIKPEI
jgi:hypothetical protein